jgi:transposase
MHVDTSTITVKGKTYTRHLLRESYRDHGKVKHRTIANISQCQPAEVEAIRLALKHKADLTHMVAASADAIIDLVQGPSVGALWLLWQVAHQMGLIAALGGERDGKLALWQVIARILDQGSRLSAVRLARTHAIGGVLGLNTGFDEDDLYGNLDWLANNQATIETKLFQYRAATDRPTEPAAAAAAADVFLYDVTSSYLEGTHNAFAAFGYNRDGKRGKRQIVIGLLCDSQGRPLSIEVFAGNTSDVKTVSRQLDKAAARFGAKHVTFVGDRGMIKSAQRQEIGQAGFHYITAITKAQIETLLSAGVLQMDLFDSELAEVDGPDGERYVLRRNPARAAELAASRQDKLATLTEAAAKASRYLQTHPRAKPATQTRKLQARAKKLFVANIAQIAAEGRTITLTRDHDATAQAAKLDGCYVLRTDLAKDVLPKEIVHDRYKDLAQVEWAFRDSKSTHLEMRPVYVRAESRTRGHALVIMLAYILLQELRKRWRDIDMTVQEALDALASLTLTEVRVSGRASYYQVPAPRDDVRRLFAAATIAIPTALANTQAAVATKKTLPSRRKQK